MRVIRDSDDDSGVGRDKDPHADDHRKAREKRRRLKRDSSRTACRGSGGLARVQTQKKITPATPFERFINARIILRLFGRWWLGTGRLVSRPTGHTTDTESESSESSDED